MKKVNVAKFVEAGLVVVKNVDANPYREGTGRHARFASYRNGKSVAATLDNEAVTRTGFYNDFHTGVIKVVSKSKAKNRNAH